MSKTPNALTCLAVLLFPAFSQAVPQLFWNEWGTIKGGDLNAANVQTIGGGSGVYAIALDGMRNRLFWGDVNLHGIYQVNFDGTGWSRVDVGVPIDNPGGVAYDPVNNVLYWSDFVLNKICRTDLNTMSTTTLLTGRDGALGMELDLVHGKLYWADFDQGGVHRCNLDGTGYQKIASAGNARDVALDVARGRVYWTSLNTGGIYSADLNGADVKQIYTSNRAYGVAVDSHNQHVYFTSLSGVSRIDLDGSNPVIGLADYNWQLTVAVLPEPTCSVLFLVGGGLILRRRRRF